MPSRTHYYLLHGLPVTAAAMQLNISLSSNGMHFVRSQYKLACAQAMDDAEESATSYG